MYIHISEIYIYIYISHIYIWETSAKKSEQIRQNSKQLKLGYVR